MNEQTKEEFAKELAQELKNETEALKDSFKVLLHAIIGAVISIALSFLFAYLIVDVAKLYGIGFISETLGYIGTFGLLLILNAASATSRALNERNMEAVKKALNIKVNRVKEVWIPQMYKLVGMGLFYGMAYLLHLIIR